MNQVRCFPGKGANHHLSPLDLQPKPSDGQPRCADAYPINEKIFNLLNLFFPLTENPSEQRGAFFECR